MTKKDRLTT